MVTIIQEKNASYLQADEDFRPSVFYPEYKFKEISKTKNYIYDMIRKGFHGIGY